VKKIVLSALALASLAGSAMAQTMPDGWAAPFRVEFAIVPRLDTGTPTSHSFTDITTPITAAAGATQRFQVRYRIVDIDGADPKFQLGLSTASFNVIASNTQVGSFSTDFQGLPAARLSKRAGGVASPRLEGVASSGAEWNDVSQLTGAPAGSQLFGIHAPFRTGVFSDPALAMPPQAGNSNGIFTAAGAIGNILPLTTTPAFDEDNKWYGVYDFNLVFGSTLPATADGTVTLGITVNAATVFGFDASVGPDGTQYQNPGQVGQMLGASIQIGGFPLVPAPGAAALLGLGGLVAARRRRA